MLAIAIPMTLAYLSTPLLGIVDTAVIGQLHSAALVGGIALAGSIFDAVFATFNFLRSGTTGLTAVSYGAGNAVEVRAVFLRALLIAVLLGLAVVAVQKPFLQIGLYLMGGSADVQAAASSYFRIRSLSTPFLLTNYVILGWFLGQGRARTGLLLQSVLNGLNIVLSISFVLGLHWGVAGVASATVLSEIVTSIFGLFLVFRLSRNGNWPRWTEIIDRERLKKLFTVNVDIMIRSFILLFAFAFFTSRSAEQGDTTLAANAILMKFYLVSGYFLDGLATAAEQLAGHAVGARQRLAFDRTIRLTILWGLALSCVLVLLFSGVGSHFVALLTNVVAVREVAAVYLPWAIITPLAGVLAYQMDGIFIGATWSREMRNMMFLSLVIYLAVYVVAFPLYGNHGLWLAINVFLGARGFTLLAICKRKADQTFRV